MTEPLLKSVEVLKPLGVRLSHPPPRNVAQFGRALALGASGRRFESCRFDLHTYYNYGILLRGILARELGNPHRKS